MSYATSLCRSTASNAQPPPRQVTFLPPSFSRSFLFPSPHSACRGGGKIIPPAPFWLGPGGSWPSPVFWAGSGPEENISFFLGRDRPNNFGLRPAQSVGPDQPSPFNIIYYIYIIFCIIYLYIYIYMKKL